MCISCLNNGLGLNNANGFVITSFTCNKAQILIKRVSYGVTHKVFIDQ